MNILVIGNGFDLAHGLPTTYADFLNFTEQICRIENYHGTVHDFESKIIQTGYDKFNELHIGVAKYIDDKIRDDKNPNEEVCDIFIERHNKIIKEIIDLTKHNIWIKWFRSSEMFAKEGWIDFESEISRVVQCFERLFRVTYCKINDTEKLSDEDTDMIKNFFKDINIYKLKIYEFQNYKKVMEQDLNNLIRSLELYLEDCVRNIEIKLIDPDIYELNIDKVLSFNYTDTFFRIYSCKNKNIDYDYIHGKSKIEILPFNNMVLGIDEYLDDIERNVNTRFIEFKKYFQRIHKATGSKYKKWIKEIEESKQSIHNVYIFGHSLDITDKDILYEFITNSKVKTTIFFKDSNAYGKQIANLVKILSQDKLISMVYLDPPQLRFIEQKGMLDKQSSGWQIFNDINSIWNLPKLNNIDIDVLFNRIEQKINEKDLSYFHNQNKVVTLYNALVLNYVCDEIKRNALLNIAYSMFDIETFAIFNTDDWGNTDYRGTSPCPPEVESFINEINFYNMRTSANYREDFSGFDINNINVLWEQINRFTIDEDTNYRLCECLFSMFDNKNINTEMIWKCIYKLSDNLFSYKWLGFIKEQLSKSTADQLKCFRLKHLKAVIDKKEFYYCKMEELR